MIEQSLKVIDHGVRVTLVTSRVITAAKGFVLQPSQCSLRPPEDGIDAVYSLHAYLWTKGRTPRLRTYPGMEVPKPVNIEICRGSADIEVVLSDVLALTKMNYNTCRFGDGRQITLKFADAIGEVLVTRPVADLPPLPFMYYIQPVPTLLKTREQEMPFESAEAFRHFVASVKHDRRYIYSTEVTSFLDAVEETAQSRIKTIPNDIHLWRAQLGSTTRVQDEGQPEEMEVDVPWMDARMKPIPALVGDGRANPRGVAYLYLADTAKTAASELRPWLGALISISQFHVNRELRIVDCTSDKKLWMKGFDPIEGRLIPWAPEEYESVVWGGIGEAMSRPYSPEESSLNYVPTQIIAERLRHGGMDGMAYNSLLSKGGHNFVLFDIRDADPVNYALHEAERVDYTIAQCDNTYFNRRKPPIDPVENP